MRKPPAITSENSPKSGSIIFGPSRVLRKNMRVYSRIFRCRKDGFDFIGQIKIDLQEAVVNVEVFNENYFDCFDTSKPNLTFEERLNYLKGQFFRYPLSRRTQIVKIPLSIRKILRWLQRPLPRSQGIHFSKYRYPEQTGS